MKCKGAVSFGSCISDFTCAALKSRYRIDKLNSLYQWRTDQFLETVVYRTSRFIPSVGLEEELAEYLDPSKGNWVLAYQKEETISAWLEKLAHARICILDNLMDLNIFLFSGVVAGSPSTKVQIRHKMHNHDLLPYVKHSPPALEETVCNNLKIASYLLGVNSKISLWYINYPYSPHVALDSHKANTIKSLASLMWDKSPDIKCVPSFFIDTSLQKDRWHYSDVFYKSVASYIYLCESGELEENEFSPVMDFDVFLRRLRAHRLPGIIRNTISKLIGRETR